MTTIHSKAFLDDILAYKLGNDMPSAPSGGMYIALLTTAPSDNTGTGAVEVSGNNYGRVQVGSDFGSVTTLNDNVTESQASNTTISFPTPSGNWGTVVGFAECTGASGALTTSSNWFTYSDLVGGSVAITSGQTVQFNSGQLTQQAV
jgi:hypothetical protein